MAERDPVRRLGGESSFTKKKEGGITINGARVSMEEERNNLAKPREVVARDKQPIKAPFLKGGAMGQ